MKNLRFLTSDTGVFGVDDEGVLRYFEAENARDEHILKRLIIPEGVVTIPDDSFRHYVVLWELKFPDSLKVLGTNDGCAFADCYLPDVELPKGIECIGTFTFGNSVIRSLRIAKGTKSEYARQFKGADIEILYLPSELKGNNRLGIERQALLAPDIGFLRGLTSGDIRAQTIVFED